MRAILNYNKRELKFREDKKGKWVDVKIPVNEAVYDFSFDKEVSGVRYYGSVDYVKGRKPTLLLQGMTQGGVGLVYILPLFIRK